MDFEWIKERRRSILNGAIVVAAMAVVAMRFFSNDTSLSDQGGDDLYESWVQDPQTDEETLQSLRRSKLTSVLSARVAQQLVMRGEGQKAEPFAQDSLNHLRSSLPEYAEFAEDGLLIANGKLEESFKRALLLKDQLQAQGKSETLLYGFNLVRLLSLTHALKKESIQMNQELESFLASGSEPARLLAQSMNQELVKSLPELP